MNTTRSETKKGRQNGMSKWEDLSQGLDRIYLEHEHEDIPEQELVTFFDEVWRSFAGAPGRKGQAVHGLAELALHGLVLALGPRVRLEHSQRCAKAADVGPCNCDPRYIVLPAEAPSLAAPDPDFPF
jgi:hypothetical protein